MEMGDCRCGFSFCRFALDPLGNFKKMERSPFLFLGRDLCVIQRMFRLAPEKDAVATEALCTSTYHQVQNRIEVRTDFMRNGDIHPQDQSRDHRRFLVHQSFHRVTKRPR